MSGTASTFLRLFREALWLRLLFAVAVLSAAFVLLGRWQLHRHEAKVARNAVIDANYTRAPGALADLLPSTSAALPAARQWTPVRVTGRYERGSGVLVRNRPLNGDYGYELILPLRTATGAVLLVDRGWLPPGEDFVRPASVPDPPPGQVTAVVRLRPGEPPLDREPPAGQELRIDVRRIAARIGGDVYRGAYGVLASEDPAPATAPTLLPRPDQSLGPHLAYAFQWWLGAVAAWFLLGRYALREARQRGHAPGTPGTPGHVSPGRAGVVRVRPRRPRRREPTDEEIEDAATGGSGPVPGRSPGPRPRPQPLSRSRSDR